MVDLTEVERVLEQLCIPPEVGEMEVTPQTRRARIEAFHHLLSELPAGPDRDAEIARRSGMTDLDFRWLVNDTERADRQADAMVEWQMEQDRAWRREIIAVLTRWDEYPLADRKALIVLMRDFFQRLADAGDRD
jgi:hypothetical protein